jgi:3-keto-5-aminohexanoate cleavage enzyme
MSTPLAADQVVITAAVVGAEVMRTDTPYVPYTPREIADEAVRCAEAGAAVVHLHARHADGRPAHELALFFETLRLIRASCDVVVQVSTGGAIGMGVAERTEGLGICPEMASLSCGSTNFGDDVFLNPWPLICDVAKRIAEAGAAAELELFDLGHLETALRVVREGHLGALSHTYQLVLGVPGAMAARARTLTFCLDELRREEPLAHVSVAAMGRHQLPMAGEALSRGAHVRVGIEDNIFLEKGVLSAGSAPQVERVVAMARAVGRTPATAAQVRAFLRT